MLARASSRPNSLNTVRECRAGNCLLRRPAAVLLETRHFVDTAIGDQLLVREEERQKPARGFLARVACHQIEQLLPDGRAKRRAVD